MATSFSMQSSLVRPASMSSVSKRSSCGGGTSQFSSVTCMPRLQRNACTPVHCMAQEEQKKEQSTTPPPPHQPMKPKTPKVYTKFSDVLAFSGPAPERINGRLPMIGFVAAKGAEIARGQGVFDQLSNGGNTAFVGTSILLSLASLIPLAFTEYVKGANLV